MFRFRSDLHTLVPPLIYCFLTVILLSDLLSAGYVITLDNAWTPTITFPSSFYGFDGDPISLVGNPFRLLIWILGSFLPSDVVEKLLLFLVFFLSGFGAHLLCPSKHSVGRYFCGFLYAVNPFVYTRFMVGHIGLLLAYSILPFTVAVLLKLLREGSVKRALTLAILLTINISIDAHITFMLALIFITLLIFRFASDRRGSVRIILLLSLTATTYMALNLYWILPYAIGIADAPIIQSFSYQDLVAFTSKTWGVGANVFFALATLYGFWRLPEGYTYVSQTLPGWWLLYAAILYLATLGFVSWKTPDERWVARGLASAGFLSLILAAGISSPITAPIFQALFQSIPFFSGMREPQKFVAILALAYSTLGGFGAGEVYASLKLKLKQKRLKKLIYVASAMILALPFTYSYNQLFGFSKQITPLSYPDEWYEAKALLDSDRSDYTILILPWHLYMYQSWIGRITANPAPKFFNKPAISGENMEWMGIETQSQKPTQHYIQLILSKRDEIRSLGNLLAPLNVKYVILLKEVDYEAYNFLHTQQDLQLILDNGKLTLFKNMHPLSKVYLVKEVREIESWSQIFELSGESLTADAYKLTENPKQTLTVESTQQPLNYIKISPIELKVEVPAEGVLIFAEPYDRGWRLNGEEPFPNLNLTNAWRVSEPGTYILRFEKFNQLLVGYISSLATLAACLTYLSVKRSERGSSTTH